FSNRRSELLTNRTEKKVKIGKCQGLFVMPTFVPFALDTFIPTFFDCLSRAIAGPHVPQYGSDLILYIVFIELLTLPSRSYCQNFYKKYAIKYLDSELFEQKNCHPMNFRK